MKTKIIIESMNGNVDFKKYPFTNATKQFEYYFDKYGHLPKNRDIVMSDLFLDEIVYVDSIEYRGIENDNFVIYIYVDTTNI